MKNIKLVVSLLYLTGAAGLTSLTPARAADVISKDVGNQGSYWHMKFPAIREETLGGSAPVLTDSNDVIDFCGSCEREPRGNDKIQAQRIELQHRFSTDYASSSYLTGMGEKLRASFPAGRRTRDRSVASE